MVMYVAHVCKNSKLKSNHENFCESMWIDKDLTQATTYPPSWKYCEKCEAKGFKNKKAREKSKTPEQIEAFKKRMKEYRDKVKS